MTENWLWWTSCKSERFLHHGQTPYSGDQQQVEWFLCDAVIGVNRLGAGRLHIEEAYDQKWWGLRQFFPLNLKTVMYPVERGCWRGRWWAHKQESDSWPGMRQYQCWFQFWTELLVSWYFEPSQPQRITSRPKTMFNLSSIYRARKSPKHKSKQHKISPDTNPHKKYTNIKHKFSKN